MSIVANSLWQWKKNSTLLQEMALVTPFIFVFVFVFLMVLSFTKLIDLVVLDM